MGSRVNIYLSDEKLFNKLNKEKNKSELISNLLMDFYNKDLDYLEGEQQMFTEKLAVNKMKIDTILEKREEIRRLDEEKSKKEKELNKIKDLANAVAEKWRSREITEKEYWSCFKGRKLNVRMARKLLR